MNDIKYYESSEFTLDRALSLKEDRQVFVVFSTLGEREAGLIFDKISLLRSETGPFIDRIYLSHRRASQGGELTEEKAREADPSCEVLLCGDIAVPDMGAETGKGADMRRALYRINQSREGSVSPAKAVIVFLDADVLEEYFGARFVLGLAGAVLSGYDFAKAGFWREKGRVRKFMAQPLFSVIDHPAVRMLTRFSYPLSGEAAGTLDFFNSVSFWQMYGVETGILMDACFGGRRIADVNLGLYDHEHQGELGIQKMSFGIARTFMRQLADYGIIRFAGDARVGDLFKAASINEKGCRELREYSLEERKYKPLKTII